MQSIQKVLDSELAQDLSSAYLQVKQSKGLQEGTLRSYVRALDIFENWRTQPYDQLNQLDMANFLNELNENGGNSATRKLRLQLRNFLGPLVENKSTGEWELWDFVTSWDDCFHKMGEEMADLVYNEPEKDPPPPEYTFICA